MPYENKATYLQFPNKSSEYVVQKLHVILILIIIIVYRNLINGQERQY